MAPLPALWIDRIWERLFAFYGARFVDFWSGEESKIASIKKIWAEELSGFSVHEIRTGLDACKKRDYPPSLPQFMSMCRPPIDYEATFYEAVEQGRLRKENKDNWSNPAIYWAASKLQFDLQQMSYDALKTRWKYAVDKAIADINDGKIPNEVPKFLTALPAPGETLVSPEKAKENLEKIQKMLMGAVKPMDGE
jgi:hypothetical protein